MTEVLFFAIGTGMGYFLSLLAFKQGSKTVQQAVDTFTQPNLTPEQQEEETITTEEGIYNWGNMEETLNTYTGVKVDPTNDLDNIDPEDKDFEELN